jgi:hypothetical protein
VASATFEVVPGSSVDVHLYGKGPDSESPGNPPA